MGWASLFFLDHQSHLMATASLPLPLLRLAASYQQTGSNFFLAHQGSAEEFQPRLCQAERVCLQDSSYL